MGVWKRYINMGIFQCFLVEGGLLFLEGVYSTDVDALMSCFELTTKFFLNFQDLQRFPWSLCAHAMPLRGYGHFVLYRVSIDFGAETM